MTYEVTDCPSSQLGATNAPSAENATTYLFPARATLQSSWVILTTAFSLLQAVSHSVSPCSHDNPCTLVELQGLSALQGTCGFLGVSTMTSRAWVRSEFTILFSEIGPDGMVLSMRDHEKCFSNHSLCCSNMKLFSVPVHRPVCTTLCHPVHAERCSPCNAQPKGLLLGSLSWM